MIAHTSAGLWTLFYFVFALCQLFPPTEFITAGLTAEKLFASLFGSEHLNFVNYHMKRTTCNIVAHLCLPLGYCLGLWWTAEGPGRPLASWEIAAVIASALLAAAGLLCWYRWWRTDWYSHPLARVLTSYSETGLWRQTASEVNREFRSVDKFATDAVAAHRVIITDNWLIKLTPYKVHLLHVDHVYLDLESSSEPHVLSERTCQTVTCRVVSMRPAVPDFVIRVTSEQLPEVRHRLGRRVRNLRNVVIHQTLTERFVDAFRRVVHENLPVVVTEDLEQCIGCGEVPAGVRLARQCGQMGPGEPCRECNCRPMWCLDCFAKWFASRQDQDQPETWLASKCPCPTCRSTFCVLDVRRVLPARS
ncbi:E3 ubiquitin-protein ligase TM129-like [Amphibalanus amphitrite]|uniref:E3 ubiquitin-protein ligase TM129-like n=1 Tax=Amphibalanus amphitrite TaxID=1232801 RepID=UPI001C8FAD1D|nr:E3 ubiquitin-protein ligase TM129-like [Amphibalanus amphitrite]XP_043188091.1 E3 ubiquitin-protein ligase TM129-like [Amphibalanus amphitrite]XP_043188092.1 E3 ubiquitin-protein ligase TM129-like [Amphibalanus amphitrite]XP_043188093.1 E3 ubiquitin-protein ligase TM129-like [Amphibalanus amphitrite]XP_043188094.1 E3 ubiquitin-protein ligase TM129-like [Amphibalanus amphitrite]XP_043204809.1 E3 ubiquitin-protein ligase TM129-like [Amphibalanus amphitrite]XP_043204810.1 E3 ubiquitin-protein